jgi:hypothetical protein
MHHINTQINITNSRWYQSKTYGIRRAIDIIETLASSFRRQFAINNWLRSSAWRDDVLFATPLAL